MALCGPFLLTAHDPEKREPDSEKIMRKKVTNEQKQGRRR